MITGKHLSRRTLLRGAGAALALPFLDAMVPALKSAATLPKAAPTRLAFLYVPNGIIMENWTPSAPGADFELTPILKPLAPHKQDLLLLSNLSQQNGYALGDGPGDHARAAASYLTGVHPYKTHGADIKNGISVDQVAADAIGKHTRFASLELGCEYGRLAGNCDSGYSCAYSNSISWRTPTQPMPPEVNPRLVFERLFGDQEFTADPAERAKRLRYKKSILDMVQDDAKSLKIDLGSTDQRKLDEYLYGIREIERRIEAAENQSGHLDPNMEKPQGVPVEFQDHVRLMMDLMLAAFQTDSTRIVTFMVGREGSNRTYREIGVPDPHHGISHHRNDPEKIQSLSKINTFHVQQLAYLLDRLKATPDGDGNLLDHSMISYGSGLADGNRHTHHHLPVLLAGRGRGALHPGRHVTYTEKTPMNNLYVSMLDRVGVEIESLGDSTGKLTELGEI